VFVILGLGIAFMVWWAAWTVMKKPPGDAERLMSRNYERSVNLPGGLRFRPGALDKMPERYQRGGTPNLLAALFLMTAARSNLMPEERNQKYPQGGQGGQQQGGGGQEGQELKPKPGRGREQHQFESPNYQPQPGHGSPDDDSFEDQPGGT
jgi:hypothetical protein